MTIGIAIAGPKAGLATFQALRAVEKIARGAIGGFVSFAAIDQQGELIRAETQRGGTQTLFVDGESTGTLPPNRIALAPLAVLMSSGPDRPNPLSQFTPGEAAVGLVTGHRLPNMCGVEGVPINALVLRSMSRGASPRQAVEHALERNQVRDFGVIAMSGTGEMFLANSAFVDRRPDQGKAYWRDDQNDLTIGVLHNAIHPHIGLAKVVVGVALDSIDPLDRHDFTVKLCAGTILELGSGNSIVLDGDNRVAKVIVASKQWLQPRCEGAAIGLAANVMNNGELLGHTVTEPYCVAEHGRLLTISGAESAPIFIRQANP